MKRRFILSAILIALLVCVFALSASAAGSSSNAFADTPDTIDGVTTPTVITTNERVVLLGADGNYYTYPAYYIVKDQTSFSIQVNDALNAKLGYNNGTNLKDYVVRIEIPSGITYMNTDLNYKSNLVYVKMSNTITSCSSKTFQECKNLETLILSNTLSAIPGDFCKTNTSLKAIEIPASVTTINGWCFNGCSSLKSVINHAENITTIGGQAFSGCPIENDFNFPDKLTSLGDYVFSSAKFYNVDLPDSITSIGQGNFQSCTNLSVLKLPELITKVPHDFAKGCTLTSLIVPKGCTEIHSQYSLGHINFNNGVIVFTGTSSSAFITRLGETNKGLVSKVVYENHCDVYFNGQHSADMEYVFTSFIESCYTEGNCTRCGSYVKGDDIAPIIKFRGIAMDIDSLSVTLGYGVDQDSLDMYLDNGYTFNYGIVAYAPEGVDCKPVQVGADGIEAVNNKTIIAKADNAYTGVDFIVRNFKEDAVSFAMCMYIYDGEKISYVCGTNANDAEILDSAYAITINIAENNISKKVTALE